MKGMNEMNTKIEEALKVSEDILNSFEDYTQKVSSVLLKCLKLARLMEDEEAIEWLSCELHGYKSSKDGIPSDLFELGASHGRENNKTDEEKNISRLEITIHEGKNRQVRRMCESVGSRVIALHRTKIGDIQVKDLELGKWRYLTNIEIKKLLNNK